MIVLVCGGRDFNDWALMTKVLDELHEKWKFKLLMNGQARGADQMSTEWAQKNWLPVCEWPANWSHLPKHSAGPIRNQSMLDFIKPNLLVAFPGGTGTADMVKKASMINLPVVHAAIQPIDHKSLLDYFLD